MAKYTFDLSTTEDGTLEFVAENGVLTVNIGQWTEVYGVSKNYHGDEGAHVNVSREIRAEDVNRLVQWLSTVSESQ